MDDVRLDAMYIYFDYAKYQYRAWKCLITQINGYK